MVLTGVVLPSESSLGRLGLTTAWMGYATIDSVRDRVKYFMSDEQVTVVESQTGMVTTFDNATGRRRRAVQVGAATDTRFVPTTTEQAVIVISGRKVFGLDKRNGDAVWEADCPNAPSTSAATDEQLAYVGSIDGSVFAFDLKFLSGLAKDITLRKYMYRALKWTYRTGGRVPYVPRRPGRSCAFPAKTARFTAWSPRTTRRDFNSRPISRWDAYSGSSGNQIVVATRI